MKPLINRLMGIVALLGLAIVVAWAVWLIATQTTFQTEVSNTPATTLEAGDAPALQEPPPERLYFIQENNGDAAIYQGDFDPSEVQLSNLQPVVNTGLPIDLAGKVYLSPNKLYLVLEVRTELPGFEVWNLMTGQEMELRVNGQVPRGTTFLSWTPDSNYVLAQVERGTTRGFWRINVLNDTGHHLYDDITPSGTGMISAHVPPSGDIILYSFTRGLGQGSEMWTMDLDGNNRQLLLTDEWHILGAMRYSPDGQRVAYMSLPDNAVPFTAVDLLVMNADGSQQQLLSSQADGGHGYWPTWSADNHTIAFVTRENPADGEARREADKATNNIYLADADTGMVWPLLPLVGQHNYFPNWSPDGDALIFISDREGIDELWFIQADGANLQSVYQPEQPVSGPMWTIGLQFVFMPFMAQTLIRQRGRKNV